MTAVEAIERAKAAGLALEVAPEGLKVRGPKAARAELIPVLIPLADEILDVLAVNATPSPALAPPAPAARSTLPDRSPCDDCRRTDWIVSVITDDGARHCPRCWRDGAVTASVPRGASA